MLKDVIFRFTIELAPAGNMSKGVRDYFYAQWEWTCVHPKDQDLPLPFPVHFVSESDLPHYVRNVDEIVRTSEDRIPRGNGFVTRSVCRCRKKELIHQVNSSFLLIRKALDNRGIRSIEKKKTSVQCPLGRKQFNVKIATEMD